MRRGVCAMSFYTNPDVLTDALSKMLVFELKGLCWGLRGVLRSVSGHVWICAGICAALQNEALIQSRSLIQLFLRGGYAPG